MKFIEKVLFLLGLFGLIAYLVRRVEFVMLFPIGLLGLAALYFIFGGLLYNDIKARGIFKKASYSGISPAKISIAIFAGLSHAMMLLAILFKIQHWPYGSASFVCGLAFSAILAGLAYLAALNKNSALLKNILIRSLIIGTAGSLLFFY